MPQTVPPSRFALAEAGTDPEAGILHAAAPFILGLVGVVIAGAVLAPGVMRNGPLLASAVLVPALIVCVGIYAWSVINPGDIVGLVVDREARMVELVQANAFSSRRTVVPFSRIARVAAEDRFDRDGYATRQAALTLDMGERLLLAFPIDEPTLASLENAFGHASKV